MPSVSFASKTLTMRPKSYFLVLPTEVRCQIYEELSQGTTQLVTKYPLSASVQLQSQSSPDLASLARTCSDLYNEIIDILYHGHFIIDVDYDDFRYTQSDETVDWSCLSLMQSVNLRVIMSGLEEPELSTTISTLENLLGVLYTSTQLKEFRIIFFIQSADSVFRHEKTKAHVMATMTDQSILRRQLEYGMAVIRILHESKSRQSSPDAQWDHEPVESF